MNSPVKLTSAQFQQLLNKMGNIQKFTVKLFNAQNRQNLIFIILNDTYHIIQYDRAILFNKITGKVNILGISGQETFNLQTEFSSRFRELIQHLDKPSEQRVLTSIDFSASIENWNHIQASKSSTIYWIPFNVNHEELGLWVEKYDDPEAAKYFENETPFLKDYLVPAYVTAWRKINRGFSLDKIMLHLNMKKLTLLSLGLLLLLLLIPIRLRVIAPCEVVAKDPYVVTAPMDGMIDYVSVDPGEKVEKDQLLFVYNDKILLYRYQVALNNVETINSELSRTYFLGTADSTENAKLTQLQLQLKSTKDRLAYTEQQLRFLKNYSPVSGLIGIVSPDEWRGRPVKTGEVIMTINNPNQSKLKIWIAEKNLIEFAKNIPIRVFLNPIPEQTFKAKLLFISPEVKISEEQIPSVKAEAEWLDPEDAPKLGLRGHALIYGERVSLLYYLLRHPINAIHKFFS